MTSNPETLFERGRLHILRAMSEACNVLYGLEQQVFLIYVAYLSRGHVLLEAEPGTAKTLSARAVAKTIRGHFERIQMTADLLPSDVLGVEIYNPKSAEFEVVPGKIVNAHLILIDEANRASPKTAAALLEPMEEGHVTLGTLKEAQTFHLPNPYMFLFTRNPVEQRGTNPLPEALLDRIMFEIKYPLVDPKHELTILNRNDSYLRMDEKLGAVSPVIDPEDILRIREAMVERMYMTPEFLKYITKVVDELRRHSDRLAGISTRCTLDLKHAAMAYAYLSGRDGVRPADVKAIAVPALAHRLFLTSEAISRRKAASVIVEILEKVGH